MSSPWIFDGHNDLPWTLRELHGVPEFDGFDFVGGDARTQTDLPRLRAGGVGAQFWSVYVPGRLAGDAAVTTTLEQIDLARRFIAAHPEHLALALTAGDVERAVASGRIASLLGAEGGHSIDSSLGVLRMLHALGVRYLTLTHNQNVPWADAATDEPRLGGLSEFGRSVVRELNRLGMFCDLSHVSHAVMRDAVALSSAPVIFSHSSAFAVTDFVRNVPDDVLGALPTNGGVCLVALAPIFVSQPVQDWYRAIQQAVIDDGGDARDLEQVWARMDAERPSNPPPECGVADVVAHIDHVREVAGLDHCGIGGDYDGSPWFPEGLTDVSGYPRILAALRERGWSEPELVQLTHGNVLRALGDLAGR